MVKIWSVFTCLNYVINPFVNLLLLSSNLVLRKTFSNRNGKKQTSYQFRKKLVSSVVEPVSPLSICSKVLERIIYNTMFKYFIENNLLSENQSGFNPSDSCVNQSLATTHEIISRFDNNSEVRGIFFDISKVFDKVWH